MDIVKDIKVEPGVAAGSSSVAPEAALPPTRVRLPDADEKPSLEVMLELWHKQQVYIDHLEAKAQKTGENISK